MTDSSRCAECGRLKHKHFGDLHGILHCNRYVANGEPNPTFRPAAPEGEPPKPAPPNYRELLGEIDNWCSGENQVDDGEGAEDALRYIRDAIRAFLAGEGPSPSEPFMSAWKFLDEYAEPLRIRDGEHKRQIVKLLEAYAEYLRKQ